MKNLAPLLTAHYLEKATHFFQGMRLLADDLPVYKTSIGLLAIHSAISLNDAILVGITGERRKAQDHLAAAAELEKICRQRKIENINGIRHFSWLLSKKTAISYGDQRIDEAVLKLSIDKAERFSNWAYSHFKEVLRVEEES